MRVLLYIVLMILFSPLLLIGIPFYFVPILLRRGKVSGTAFEAFNGRLVYHLLGRRPDAAAERLAKGLPATNPVCRILLFKPLILATRLSGHTPVYLRYPPPHPAPMGAMIGLRCEFTYGEAFTFGFPDTPDLAGGLEAYLEEHGLTLEEAVPFGARGEGRAPCGGLLLARPVAGTD
jgi:hypothetical protein